MKSESDDLIDRLAAALILHSNCIGALATSGTPKAMMYRGMMIDATEEALAAYERWKKNRRSEAR